MEAGPVRQAFRRLSPRALAFLAAGAVLVVAAAGMLLVDFDDDGLNGWQEWRFGTDPVGPDTDQDGLSDGDEVFLGTHPRRPDTDQDGLRDGVEVERRGDPRSGDSDGDGIPDAAEPDEDCDGDGVPAIASADDDGDGLPDAAEPEEALCDPDADGDGVLDGDERNALCILRTDCDGDGLDDLKEKAAGYDPLDPDTFSSGLPDAVVLAFQEQGQSPTPDDDGDGIPDGWETSGGLIDWGPFTPRPEQRDLLIEYLRVVGPDSGRFASMDFTPTYRSVAAMFAAEGITLQWKETLVVREAESRPDFLTPDDLAYYRSVLDAGTSSTNPYVTSVILNPQQVQTHGPSILGAAFLRNMVATVDYGAHTEVVFRTDDGQTQSIRPVVESQLIGGLQFQGYDMGGVRADGQLFLHRPAQGPSQPGYTVSWYPNWFRTAPLYEADNSNATLKLTLDGARLHTDELASTIAHELGHTLSLCHTHETECAASYGGLTGAQVASSTMSYAASATALSFLDVEWDALRAHLACAPQTTAALVAEGADRDAILSAKYEAAFTQVVQQRECASFVALAHEFDPTTEPMHWAPAALTSTPGEDGGGERTAYIVVSLLAAVGAAALALRSRRH